MLEAAQHCIIRTAVLQHRMQLDIVHIVQAGSCTTQDRCP